MATLKLKSITCIEQAEVFTDELYVIFNGIKRSLPNMTRGQTKTLNDEFQFQGSSELSLFENDGDHWYDRDDFIAKHLISEQAADLVLDFKATSGNGVPGHYTISVGVEADQQVPINSILRLNSITCIRQAEVFTDELYVTFNGTKRSLPNMTQGNTKTLNDEFLFQGSSELSLFENDGDHWYDRDDFIAKHLISEQQADLVLDFKATSGNAVPGHYTINLSVNPDRQVPITSILRLNSITCIRQAEIFTDELYVTFNGTKRSLPNMTQGQTKALNDEFLFQGLPELSLFENDGDHWYDRDDFIAKHTITQSPANLALDFKATSGNGLPGHYTINVSIT